MRDLIDLDNMGICRKILFWTIFSKKERQDIRVTEAIQNFNFTALEKIVKTPGFDIKVDLLRFKPRRQLGIPLLEY